MNRQKGIFLLIILILVLTSIFRVETKSDYLQAIAPSGNWWNEAYLYRNRLTVTTGANAPFNGYNGYTARVLFDTASLISATKMQTDCDDLRMVYWSGSVWVELDRHIINCNNASSDIRFQLQAAIADSSIDDNYYVYYGNSTINTTLADLSNVYLWYDDATSDRLSSYTLGRGDEWHGTGGTDSFTYNGFFDFYEYDTNDNVTNSMRIPSASASERDAYIEMEFFHLDAYPNDMSSGVLGRYTLDSGSGATESSNNYYATNRADSPFEPDAGYAEDISIVRGGRTTTVMDTPDGAGATAIAGNQWRKQALAIWGVNSTNGRYWDNDVSATMGPIGYPSQAITKSGTDGAGTDVEASGEWGVIVAQDAARIRNILIRRYTDPEPTTSVSAEESRFGFANDFRIQRGTNQLTGVCTTLTAGTDYDSPSADSRAFVRITNTHHTGAGNNTGGGVQASDDVMIYVNAATNLTSSFQLCRASTATGSSFVVWEVIEYVGVSGGPNELIVHDVGISTYGTANTTVSTGAIGGVVSDGDIVPFITGQATPDTGQTDYNTGLSTAVWDFANDEIDFTRGESSGDAAIVSWAVVEFVGENWLIQRSEHTYSSAGTNETESITPVNDLSRAFLHVQKRAGSDQQGLDEFGHEVYLSNTSTITYQIQSGATTPSLHTSVAWVIENTQTTGTTMNVIRSNGTQSGGAEPSTVNVNIGQTISSLSNSSIFTNNRSTGGGTAYPRPIMGVQLISTTQYQLFISDTGQTRTYRTEVVEWPIAPTELVQSTYRFYGNVDSTDVGTPLAAQDTPATLSVVGEEFRLRLVIDFLNRDASINTQTLKLQVAERVGTCDNSFVGESYVDVTGATEIAFNPNTTPSDGDALTPNLNDPVTSSTQIPQSYEESNNFSNNQSTIVAGQNGLWDFSLIDNSPSNKTYCLRAVQSTGSVLDNYTILPEISTNPGSLSVDIVNGGGNSVANPAVIFSPISVSFADTTSIGTLSTLIERIRVTNTTSNPQWSLSLAALSGTTSFWDGGLADFDFNDPTANANDGADLDNLGGQLSINPTVGNIVAQGICSNTGISLGSSSAYSEGITDVITLASANGSAETDCDFDILNIDVSQTIPAEQVSDTYAIDMMLTIVAI